MLDQKETAEVRSFMLYPSQQAVILQLAKDQGYSSQSSALRRIIDEWVEFKTHQLVDTPAAYEAR